MLLSASFQALDVGWFHILHQHIAVRALLTQEGARLLAGVDRSPVYSAEALVWLVYCQANCV